MGQDGTETSPAVSVQLGRVLSNFEFKDYAPAYFKPNSVAIISYRGMSAWMPGDRRFKHAGGHD